MPFVFLRSEKYNNFLSYGFNKLELVSQLKNDRLCTYYLLKHPNNRKTIHRMLWNYVTFIKVTSRWKVKRFGGASSKGWPQYAPHGWNRVN